MFDISRVRWIERIFFVLLVISMLFLGFWQGLQVHSVTLDLFFIVLEVFWLEAFFSAIIFSSIVIFSFVLFFLRLGVSRRRKNEEETEGDFVCVVPTYMDSETLDRSIESLLSSSYENFEIVIVCEKEDGKAIERAEKLSDRYDRVNFLVNEKYPGSKAGAMNLAIESTDSEFVAIFDADQKIAEDFLARAAQKLLDYDAVQARNITVPGNLVESLAYYGSCFNYLVRQPLSVLTSFTLLGSGCSAFTRDSLEKIGGFSERTLTEDYEISHRYYVSEFNTAEILSKSSEEDSASSFVDYWCQRKRWLKGNMQVTWIRLNELRYLDNYRYLTSFLLALSGVFGIVFAVTLISKFMILALLGFGIAYLIPLALVSLVSLLFGSYDSYSNEIDMPKFLWIFSPIIFPLFGLIATKSILELVFRRENSWYMVEK